MGKSTVTDSGKNLERDDLMLAELRDYLKTLDVADYYSIGKIDNSKEKSLGVYADSTLRRVEAIGKNKSYGIFQFRILLHWNKNLKETETQARSIFDQLRYITNTDMDTMHVQYLDLEHEEPIFVGTDSNGVYEYVIKGNIYYRG